ncbi:MAG: hypothetical protein WC119_00945 [Synergistaceae bacterium]
MANQILISGFSKEAINGTYSYWKQVNGYDGYQKDSTHIIIYQPKYGEYCQTPAYYILENKQLSGAIPKWLPVARIEGTSVEGTWINMKDYGSGETTTGTVIDESSSSSSYRESSSSSSS